MRWSQCTVDGRGDLGQPGGHELQQRHLRRGVLHRHPIGMEVGVADAPLELLAGVGEVVDEDLLGQRQRPAEALAGSGDTLGERGVDALDEIDGGGGGDGAHAGGSLSMVGDVVSSGLAFRAIGMTTIIQVSERGQPELIDDSGPGVRRIRYAEIADELRARARTAPAGSLLPSEAALSEEFGASRVTVRRALDLVARGRPDRGPAGLRVVRGHRTGGADGSTPSAPSRTSWPPAGEPTSAGSSSSPSRRLRPSVAGAARGRLGAARQAGQPRRRRAVRRRHRVVPGGARRRSCHATTSSATRSTSCCRCARAAPRRRSPPASPAPSDAALLAVPEGAPLLQCERVTTDEDGRPVLVSEHVFPAHRTEFVVELPNALPSTLPSGLRLVEEPGYH